MAFLLIVEWVGCGRRQIIGGIFRFLMFFMWVRNQSLQWLRTACGRKKMDVPKYYTAQPYPNGTRFALGHLVMAAVMANDPRGRRYG